MLAPIIAAPFTSTSVPSVTLSSVCAIVPLMVISPMYICPTSKILSLKISFTVPSSEILSSLKSIFSYSISFTLINEGILISNVSPAFILPIVLYFSLKSISSSSFKLTLSS